MFEPTINPSPELLEKQQSLYFIFGIGLILTLIQFFISFSLSFSNLMILMFLWCAAAFFNYFIIVTFVIFTIVTMLQYVCVLGILIQVYIFTGEYAAGGKNYTVIVASIMLITLIYDVVAIKVSYNAYRIFKYHSYRAYMVAGAQSSSDRYGNRDEHDRLLHGNRDEETNRRGFSAFHGTGVRLG